MHAPLYSTIALIAELFVSAAVFFSFYQGYRHNRFPEKVAIGALLYETLFNISYMLYRVPADRKGGDSTGKKILGAIHGSLSLVMFVSLIVFFVLAIRSYRKNINYFRVHRSLALIFLVFWSISIATGIALYFTQYPL